MKIKTVLFVLFLFTLPGKNFLLAQTTYTFTGNGNWSNAVNWSDNVVPPAVLTAGNAIVIDPVSYGECVLDVQQTILYGASFTVMPGKHFRMPYNLVISRPPNASDSVSVLTRLEDNYGGKIYFTFDTVNKRYSNWYSYYRSYNYDTTYINYNSNGKVWYLLKKASGGASLSVFEYSGAGVLSKIYAKRDLSTDTSDPYYIASYDSLVYNDKQQLVSLYTFYSYGLGAYNYFYYNQANDSLLEKMVRYALSATGQFVMNDSMTYEQYDNSPNPFYKYFSQYGLYGGSGIFPLPRYAIQGSGNPFSTISADNCTKANGTTINYSYNSDLVPVKCYVGSAATGDWNVFYYKKVHQ